MPRALLAVRDAHFFTFHVFPIEGTLEPPPAQPLAARLVSTDLVTGETAV